MGLFDRIRRAIDARRLQREVATATAARDWDTYDLDSLLDGPAPDPEPGTPEYGRRLASEREDLIAQGHDPAGLAEPLEISDVARRLKLTLSRRNGWVVWDRSGPAMLTRAPISETHYELRSWARTTHGYRLLGQMVVHSPGWRDDEDNYGEVDEQPEITWGPPNSGVTSS